MNPSESNALHILHVFSAIALVALTFYACAGAPETRKKVLMWSGIASLVALLTGLRLWQGLYGFHVGWPVVKLLCWLAISAFAGVAYRKREKAPRLIAITLALGALAVAMVYLKPF